MFVDASAIVALLAREPEADQLAATLERNSTRTTSALAIWEATVALSRDLPINRAEEVVRKFLRAFNVAIVLVGDREAEIALMARAKYGTGRYALNFGDCFAYACAKANRVPLLFVGNDFTKTDVNDGYAL